MYLSCTTCALRGTGRDEIEETFRLAPAVGFRHWGLGGPFTMFPGLMQWMDVGKIKRRMAEVGLETLTEVWSPPIPTESLEKAALGAEQVALAAAVAAQLDCRRLVQTGGPRQEGGIRQTIDGLSRLLEFSIPRITQPSSQSSTHRDWVSPSTPAISTRPKWIPKR